MEPDNFDINPKAVPNAKPPDIPPHLRSVATDTFTLFVSDLVINGVREYLASDQNDELGGCLHGQMSETDGRTVVEITGFTPLPSNDRGSTHFVFGHAAKEHMLRVARTRPDRIVGWFHSHPKMGDPFMSLQDRDVHGREYNKFWQISLVVAVGEWGMPIGFWRMELDRLIPIQRYHVIMTPGANVGDSDRRYLRASFGDGASANVVLARVRRILDALQEPLLSDLDKWEPGTLSPVTTGSDSIVLLRTIVALAQSLASGELDHGHLDKLVARLRSVHMLQQRTHRLMISAHIEERLAIMGDRALTFSTGSGKICTADFKENVVGPQAITGDFRIIAGAAHLASNRVWLLSENGLLAALQITERKKNGSKRDTNRYNHRFDVSQLTQPVDLAARSDHLLLKSGDQLIVLSIQHPAKDDASEKGAGVPMSQPGGDWMLVHHHMEDDVTLLRRDGSTLELVGRNSETLATGNPIAELAGCEIMRVLATPSGIWLLLDQSDMQKIVRLRSDLKTVELTILVDPAEPPGRVTDVTVDERHRVFLIAGDSIFLILETGAPNVDWYRNEIRHVERDGKLGTMLVRD